MVGYRPGRKSNISENLAGLSHIKSGLTLGLHTGFIRDKTAIKLSASKQITGAKGGWQARLDLQQRIDLTDKLDLKLSRGLGWADQSYMQTHFEYQSHGSIQIKVKTNNSLLLRVKTCQVQSHVLKKAYLPKN